MSHSHHFVKLIAKYSSPLRFFSEVKIGISHCRKHLPMFRRQIIVLKCLTPWRMNETSSYRFDAISNNQTVLLQVIQLCTVRKKFLATIHFRIQTVYIFSFSDCCCWQKYEYLQKLDRRCVQQTCVAWFEPNRKKRRLGFLIELVRKVCAVNSEWFFISNCLLSILIDKTNIKNWQGGPQQSTFTVQWT